MFAGKMKLLLLFFLWSTVSGIKKDCPDGAQQCPDSATCCKLLDKSYGCCPLKDAICCDDHIHCCPVNTKCSTGMCIQQDLHQLKNVTATLVKFNVKSNKVKANDVKSKNVKANNVTCPGGNFTCPDSTTCCESVVPGIYGCCPLLNAVCCNDKQHCCPSGTVCDLERQTCNGDSFVSQMYDSKKMSFKSHVLDIEQVVQMEASTLGSVVCPGSTFQCPNGNTCCKLSSGEWGCCPFPMATCCKDGLHCCPQNMKCDATSSFCSQGPNKLASYRNIPAVSIVMEKNVCPDKSECQVSMTCCPIGDKRYGCCQYQNATCCADKLHCCPSGSKCDMAIKQCIPESHPILNVIN